VHDQLFRIDATEPTATVRERELETGRLLLRAVAAGDAFLVRRAAGAAAALDAGPARRVLLRAAGGLAEGDAGLTLAVLLGYGAVLERHGEDAAALDVYRAVRRSRPDDACVALHAARSARKSGRREEALALYGAAAATCGDDHLRHLAAIGAALVSDDPFGQLSGVVRAAREAGDGEALALAREERARLELAARRPSAAVRDLMAAALRFPDRTDRVRVLHRLAELLGARGDLAGAREALLMALDIVDQRHRAHTIQRLRTLARAMGDQLELRRTRGQGAAGLVTLAPLAVRRLSAMPSRAGRIRRWRSLLAGASAAT
jgi:tetratricopeptide (TPR) repeat protein